MRRTKAEAEQTRSSLLDAAEELFLRQGVARTTLEMIARAAGVTRGAVYWHFPNKVELFEAMQERVLLPEEEMIQRMEQARPDDAATVLRETFTEAFHMIATDERRRRVFTILLLRCEYVEEMQRSRNRMMRAKQESLDRTTAVLGRLAGAGRLNPVWTPETAGLYLHSLFIGLMLDYLGSPDSMELGQAESIISSAITTMVGA